MCVWFSIARLVRAVAKVRAIRLLLFPLAMIVAILTIELVLLLGIGIGWAKWMLHLIICLGLFI